MSKKELQALTQQAAKNIKSERDLCDFSVMLKKITVEAALNAELDEHLAMSDTSHLAKPGSEHRFC